VEPVVEVVDLRKRYGRVVAVDGISFTVGRGEIFGIVGPNGAGKSTTVECLAGLREKDGGTVSVLGLDPLKDGRKLRERIGVQLQEAALPDDVKVWEALDLYASFYGRSAGWEGLLQRWGLAPKRDTRFENLSGVRSSGSSSPSRSSTNQSSCFWTRSPRASIPRPAG
jgi:ABC-2 type transport system ATP-binding protein